MNIGAIILLLVIAIGIAGIVGFVVFIMSIQALYKESQETTGIKKPIIDEGWKQRAEQILKDMETQNKLAREKAEIQARTLADKKNWELLRKFQCGVCGRKSNKPSRHYVAPYYDYGVQTGGGYTQTSWTEPGDMAQCKKCGRWACTEPEAHIHAGICRNHV